MELKSCRECKKLFKYETGKVVCTQCRKRHEEYLDEIRAYLMDYPNATFKMINEEIGVSIKLIEEFIRDGRLEISSGSPLCLSCSGCGTQITKGRICEDCRQSTLNDVVRVGQEFIKEEKKVSLGMHGKKK